MLLMSTILLCTPLAALWPSMPGPPKFTGPHHVQIQYNGWDLTDFVFNCTILYKKVTADDGARFDVALSFDDVVDEATVKTTTSLDTTVVFNSTDLRGHFGTKVGMTHTSLTLHIGLLLWSLYANRSWSLFFYDSAMLFAVCRAERNTSIVLPIPTVCLSVCLSDQSRCCD